MQSVHISLTDELMAVVQCKVTSGLYDDASDVIREAIRHLESHEQWLHGWKIAQLRAALDPALQQAASGEYADYAYDSFMAEIDRELPSA